MNRVNNFLVNAIGYGLDYCRPTLDRAADKLGRASRYLDTLKYGTGKAVNESPIVKDPLGTMRKYPGRTGIVSATGLGLLTLAGVMSHREAIEFTNNIAQVINTDGGSISQDEISAFVANAVKEGKLEQLQKDIRSITWADRSFAQALQVEVDRVKAGKADSLVQSLDRDKNGTIGFEDAVSHVAEIAKSDSSPGFSTDETGRLDGQIKLLNDTNNSAVGNALQAAKASYNWNLGSEVKLSK